MTFKFSRFTIKTVKTVGIKIAVIDEDNTNHSELVPCFTHEVNQHFQYIESVLKS